jgi:hypothetical protein
MRNRISGLAIGLVALFVIMAAAVAVAAVPSANRSSQPAVKSREVV